MITVLSIVVQLVSSVNGTCAQRRMECLFFWRGASHRKVDDDDGGGGANGPGGGGVDEGPSAAIRDKDPAVARLRESQRAACCGAVISIDIHPLLPYIVVLGERDEKRITIVVYDYVEKTVVVRVRKGTVRRRRVCQDFTSVVFHDRDVADDAASTGDCARWIVCRGSAAALFVRYGAQWCAVLWRTQEQVRVPLRRA